MSVTATIKLTKEEVEKIILSLTFLIKIKDVFSKNEDIKGIEKLREDFIDIKNFIIEGENDNAKLESLYRL